MLDFRRVYGRGAGFTDGEWMRLNPGLFFATLLPGMVFLVLPAHGFSQTPRPPAGASTAKALPNAPQPQTSHAAGSAAHTVPLSERQPKRILDVMPNYRAVSAGTHPPPPTPKEAFKVASDDSFDYSAYVFAGLTSLLAEGDDAHPTLGKGVGGFWAYTWRGYLDKTDGNYWVMFIMPTMLHEDERYYAMGRGNFWKRVVYSTTRVIITPNYKGRNTFNAAELLGRGIAEGISVSYYPSSTQTAGATAERYGYAVLRDASTNAFREFWPDINAYVFHHRH